MPQLDLHCDHCGKDVLVETAEQLNSFPLQEEARWLFGEIEVSLVCCPDCGTPFGTSPQPKGSWAVDDEGVLQTKAVVHVNRRVFLGEPDEAAAVSVVRFLTRRDRRPRGLGEATVASRFADDANGID